MKIRIAWYERLSPKRRQHVNMLSAGLLLGTLALVVSGMIGGPDAPTAAPTELPKPRGVGTVPGAQLDAKDAWMGGAGKDLANLRDTVTQQNVAVDALRAELTQQRLAFKAELAQMQERVGSLNQSLQGGLPGGVGRTDPALPVFPAASSVAGPLGPVPLPSVAAGRTGAAMPAMAPPGPPPAAAPAGPGGLRPANAPQALPGPGRPAAGPAAFPPGTPNAGAPSTGQQGAALGELAPPPAPAMMRVSLTPPSHTSQATGASAAASDGAASSSGAAAQGASRAPNVKHVGSYLPVSFTRAVLLGGLAAPTGGQAQSNPVPVLLRLADLAMLPNGFRSQVKDCLVVAEGFGDQSAERAYVRTTLLSCVLHDGRVVEVPIKGSVFGEDGMNGVKGTLVTKQGAILTNALLAGIASGIGSGISTATTTVSTSPLGAVTVPSSDTASILKQGVGTGVGRALDRLAQYYISLAEKTFPVIEVQPGRYVDIVLREGVSLGVAIAAVAPSGAPATPARGTAPDTDRRPLMQVTTTRGDEE